MAQLDESDIAVLDILTEAPAAALERIEMWISKLENVLVSALKCQNHAIGHILKRPANVETEGPTAEPDEGSEPEEAVEADGKSVKPDAAVAEEPAQPKRRHRMI